MTAIAKVLAIFITVASVIYMASALVLTAAPNPNWEAQAEMVPNFRLSQTTGEKPQWTLTHIISGESFSNAVLPNVIESAYKHLTTKLDEETQIPVAGQIVSMVDRTSALSAEIGTYDNSVDLDKKALETRHQSLLSYLDKLQKDTLQASQDANKVTNVSQQTRVVSDLRREDIQRLTSQLDEINIDHRRIEDQQKQLNDLIIRFEGAVIRLENRNQLLKSQSKDGSVPKQ